MIPNIQVILGSIRAGRVGEKVAQWFMETMSGRTDAQFQLVDLRDYPLPLFADAVPPSQREGKHADPAVQKWLDTVAAADGYVWITPEYNHSFSSALKNALDYPYKEWNGKPVGFVSYGGVAAGSRATEHLRQVAAELRMYDVRDQVLIPAVWAAFDAAGVLLDAEKHRKNADLMVTEVIRLAREFRKSG